MKKLLFATLFALVLSSPALAQDCSQLTTQLDLDGGLAAPERKLISDSRIAVAWPHLQQAFNRLKPEVEDVELQQLSYAAGSYQIQMIVRQWFFWDNLTLKLDFADGERLRLRLQDNWIPTDLILSRVASRLQSAIEGLPIQLSRPEQALELRLDPADIVLKAQQLRLSTPRFKGAVEPNGQLALQLSSGATSPATAPGNGLALSSSLCGSSDSQLAGDFKTDLTLNLKPDDLRPITLGSEKLIERLQAAQGKLSLAGKAAVTLAPFGLSADGTMHFDFDALEIEQKRYQEVKSVPFRWRYSFPDDFDIYPELAPPLPVSPNLSSNKLEIITEGPAYSQEIMGQIATARHSVEQEVFAFHTGQTTESLTRLLILKAMGYQETGTELGPDTHAPQGIAVKLLHNHYLTHKGTREVTQLFAKSSDEVFAALAKQLTSSQIAQL
ncbi:MAG: hypothetical protein CVV27_12860, partial [Candidatus Melainabacteria bacterium HGW-Melainabacteria-1]